MYDDIDNKGISGCDSTWNHAVTTVLTVNGVLPPIFSSLLASSGHRKNCTDEILCFSQQRVAVTILLSVTCPPLFE